MSFVNKISCLSIDENHFFDKEDDMGMAESISKLFMQLVERHGGNKADAARSLGVDPTTFWNWASGKRSFNPALCQAIDRAGGILLIPGDSVPASGETKPQAAPRPQGAASDRISELEAQVKELEAQVRALEIYKHKWEGHIEAVRAQGSGLSMPVEKKRSA